MNRMTRLHALLIGVDRCEDSAIHALDAAGKDVKTLYEVLVDPNLCGYHGPDVHSITGRHACKDGIFTAIESLHNKCGVDDTVIIYFSGHGMAIEEDGSRRGYLLPYDGRSNVEDIEMTWLPVSTFMSACDAIQAGRIVIVLDCCYAGSAELLSQVLTKFDVPRGRVLLASSPANAESYTDPTSGLSRFTGHFVAALRGGAAGKEGTIRVFEVFEYIERSMKSKLGLEKVQRPIFKADVGENFAMALWRGGQEDDRDESPFDAYVSFAEQDGDWVYEVLLPALEQQGLRICTSDLDASTAGGYRVANVERAIEQSRRVVLILSPHHLESSWAHYETMLGRTRAVEDQKPRLIPFLRESMTLKKLFLRSLQPIDYSHPRFGGNEAINRLCMALRRPIH